MSRKKTVKRGSWSQPKRVLQYNHNSPAITVAGKGVKFMIVAFEDVRYALALHDLTQLLQEAMDVCDELVTDDIANVSDISRNDYRTPGTIAGSDDFANVNNGSSVGHPITDEFLTYTPCAGTVQSAKIELPPDTSISSSIQEDICSYESRFGSKEFMKHEAEGLPSHIIHNTYAMEENASLKSCTQIHRSKIPNDANFIGSHVFVQNQNA